MLQKKKLVMGQVDPKGLPCHKSRALAPVFTKKPLIFIITMK